MVLEKLQEKMESVDVGGRCIPERDKKGEVSSTWYHHRNNIALPMVYSDTVAPNFVCLFSDKLFGVV